MRLLLAALLCTAPLDAYHHGARGGLSRGPRADSLARRRSSALRAFDPREPTRGFGKPGDGAQRNPDLLRKQIEERGNRVFDELVGEFPTLFTLKVVGADDNSFASDMVALIAEATGKSASSIQYSINSSSGGKYVSVTIQAPVASPDEVYECYAKLRGDPRVKMAL